MIFRRLREQPAKETLDDRIEGELRAAGIESVRIVHKAVPSEPEMKLTPEEAAAFLAEEDLPRLHPAIDAGKASVFEQKRCQHCGGCHDRKCPAVKEIEYHPDGKVKRVVYFPHGQWPTDGVIWLEDIMAALAAGEGSEEHHGG